MPSFGSNKDKTLWRGSEVCGWHFPSAFPIISDGHDAFFEILNNASIREYFSPFPCGIINVLPNLEWNISKKARGWPPLAIMIEIAFVEKLNGDPSLMNVGDWNFRHCGLLYFSRMYESIWELLFNNKIVCLAFKMTFTKINGVEISR